MSGRIIITVLYGGNGMKIFTKIASLVLIVVMAATLFASCGGGAPSGETKTLNNVTVLVPDGFDVKEGLIPSSIPVVVFEKDHETKYVNVGFYDSVDEAKESIDMMVGDLETADVKFDAAGVTWEGKSYDLGGWPMCNVIATIGDQVVMCQASFFASDDATMRAIIDSIKLG